MERQFVIDNMAKILMQVKKIADGREYALGITHVYYAGGTLCIDIYDKGILKYIVMVNISDETYTINESTTDGAYRGLLGIDSLKLAFELYEMTKGKTEYFNECFGNSCLRHLA